MADRAICSTLEIQDSWKEKNDGLEDLYELQNKIQTEVYGYDFEYMREEMSRIREFFDLNNLAIKDEQMEQHEALGGVDSYGNAIWKPWKKDHEKANNRMLFDLEENEIVELKFELIDELHFLFNKMLAVGMTTKEIYNMYYAKNLENIKRQKRGY